MKIHMISLGCDKNLVDAEMMLGLSKEGGYQYTEEEEQADIIIVNTCCFILEAKEESIGVILAAARQKTEGQCKALIVTGCMAQRYKEEILKEIPEVDALLGTSNYDKIVSVLDAVSESKKSTEFLDLDRLPDISKRSRSLAGSWYAYLKIAEGCDKNCTYCIIPSLRGHYRSYPMDAILKQAKELVRGGVRELILVAQETTLYGTDLYGKKTLPDLLRALCRIEELRWVRILYCYPEELTDEMISVIASEEKICNYLDIPIQHASDRILRRMGRRTNQADIRAIVKKLRSRIPDLTLRTTLITGFPGEEEEDFAILSSFVEEMQFERLGVFCYSKEEDTPAWNLSHHLPESVKRKRRDAIMALQQGISKRHLQEKIGKTLFAMVEGRMPDSGVYLARGAMDAPGVDGNIFFESEREHICGDFVEVLITDASEYDLMGEAI